VRGKWFRIGSNEIGEKEECGAKVRLLKQVSAIKIDTI
jgi:hypothetical protein